jgi:hypothetical protein
MGSRKKDFPGTITYHVKNRLRGIFLRPRYLDCKYPTMPAANKATPAVPRKKKTRSTTTLETYPMNALRVLGAVRGSVSVSSRRGTAWDGFESFGVFLHAEKLCRAKKRHPLHSPRLSQRRSLSHPIIHSRILSCIFLHHPNRPAATEAQQPGKINRARPF